MFAKTTLGFHTDLSEIIGGSPADESAKHRVRTPPHLAALSGSVAGGGPQGGAAVAGRG